MPKAEKAPKKAAVEAVKQPTPTATTTQETTTQPKTETVKPPIAQGVSKQQQTINRLREAWTQRGVSLEALTETQDGKYIMLTMPNFPTVRVGSSGGLDLPTIKSYAKAFEAAVEADKLLAKQREREAKKSAATTAPAKPVESKATTPKAESTTTKKQRVAKEIEQKLQQASA